MRGAPGSSATASGDSASSSPRKPLYSDGFRGLDEATSARSGILPGHFRTVMKMTSDSNEAQIARARDQLEEAKTASINLAAEIQKMENEIQTASSIGDRDVANLERQAQDAQLRDEFDEMRHFQEEAARRRARLAEQINELEARLGELKGLRIGTDATVAAQESTLAALKARAEEEAEQGAVSEQQVRRAAELEKRLEQLEQERGDLVARIEQYAPVVEAHREAAAGSGSEELSKAYADQADDYRKEWKLWLKRLCIAVVVALIAGVIVIVLAHPSDDASNGTIASRIAIEILVLGLLVYAVRVSAHQFRVHRHLETACRSKASALKTFNRLVAGPGEAEVRTAVAVALAQAVFDSNSTGFIDSSQDGVTIVERFGAPVVQRLSGN